MTEDEATSKWCPFARVGYGRSRNSGAEDSKTLCIGSACMAWRSREIKHLDSLGNSYELRRQAAQKKWQTKETAYTFEAVETDGYCGLAGTP